MRQSKMQPSHWTIRENRFILPLYQTSQRIVTCCGTGRTIKMTKYIGWCCTCSLSFSWTMAYFACCWAVVNIRSRRSLSRCTRIYCRHPIVWLLNSSKSCLRGLLVIDTKMNFLQHVALVALTLLYPAVYATPFGAPPDACVSMTPQHGFDVQSSPAPYGVHPRRVGNLFEGKWIMEIY